MNSHVDTDDVEETRVRHFERGYGGIMLKNLERGLTCSFPFSLVPQKRTTKINENCQNVE